ncbi:MAG: alanyl-tRNA editing protein [Angelakisella sp.]
MTKKLYEDNAMLTTCTATVLDCIPAVEGFELVLDQTVFFPEGGGQLSDRGMLGSVPVSHVREREGVVYHLCSGELAVGSTVEAAIDWQVRLDHMQQHTGEHILSHTLWKLFGAANIGFHMSSGEQVTIDMDMELTREQLAEAEDYANRQIWENHPVTCYIVDEDAAAKLELRKKTDKVQGDLRIVEIEDGDTCTCCGTHLPYTGMVGAIHIIKQERYKGGVRILFLCGRWALADFRRKNSLILEAGAILSAKPEAVPDGIRKLREDSSLMGARLRTKTAALWDCRVQELTAAAGDSGCICTTVEDCTPAEAKLLLQKLTENPKMTAVVVYACDDRVNYLIGKGEKGKGDCGFLCQIANGLFNGKGGGKGSFAQGGGSLTKDWKDRAQQLLAAMQRG